MAEFGQGPSKCLCGKPLSWSTLPRDGRAYAIGEGPTTARSLVSDWPGITGPGGRRSAEWRVATPEIKAVTWQGAKPLAFVRGGGRLICLDSTHITWWDEVSDLRVRELPSELPATRAGIEESLVATSGLRTFIRLPESVLVYDDRLDATETLPLTGSAKSIVPLTNGVAILAGNQCFRSESNSPLMAVTLPKDLRFRSLVAKGNALFAISEHGGVAVWTPKGFVLIAQEDQTITVVDESWLIEGHLGMAVRRNLHRGVRYVGVDDGSKDTVRDYTIGSERTMVVPGSGGRSHLLVARKDTQFVVYRPFTEQEKELRTVTLNTQLSSFFDAVCVYHTPATGVAREASVIYAAKEGSQAVVRGAKIVTGEAAIEPIPLNANTEFVRLVVDETGVAVLAHGGGETIVQRAKMK